MLFVLHLALHSFTAGASLILCRSPHLQCAAAADPALENLATAKDDVISALELANLMKQRAIHEENPGPAHYHALEGLLNGLRAAAGPYAKAQSRPWGWWDKRIHPSALEDLPAGHVETFGDTGQHLIADLEALLPKVQRLAGVVGADDRFWRKYSRELAKLEAALVRPFWLQVKRTRHPAVPSPAL